MGSQNVKDWANKSYDSHYLVVAAGAADRGGHRQLHNAHPTPISWDHLNKYRQNAVMCTGTLK